MRRNVVLIIDHSRERTAIIPDHWCCNLLFKRRVGPERLYDRVFCRAAILARSDEAKYAQRPRKSPCIRRKPSVLLAKNFNSAEQVDCQITLAIFSLVSGTGYRLLNLSGN